MGETNEGNEDAIQAGDGFLLVAEDGEGDTKRLGKGCVPLAAVDADADNLRAGLLELGDITLIRPELACSAAGKGLDIEGQHDAFLAAKIGELNGRALLIGQREIGGNVANLERALGHAAPC